MIPALRYQDLACEYPTLKQNKGFGKCQSPASRLLPICRITGLSCHQARSLRFMTVGITHTIDPSTNGPLETTHCHVNCRVAIWIHMIHNQNPSPSYGNDDMTSKFLSMLVPVHVFEGHIDSLGSVFIPIDRLSQ